MSYRLEARRPRWLSGLALGLVVALMQITGLPAQAEPFVSRDWGFAVDLPKDCFETLTPDGVLATCARAGGVEASKSAVAALALVLEVEARPVPEDKGLTPEQLAAAFTLSEFESEVPGGVCGEETVRGVKIENAVREAPAGANPVVSGFAARVTCPPISLLGVPERVAHVRYLATDRGIRYRVMARAPATHMTEANSLVRAFMASFTVRDSR